MELNLGIAKLMDMAINPFLQHQPASTQKALADLTPVAPFFVVTSYLVS